MHPSGDQKPRPLDPDLQPGPNFIMMSTIHSVLVLAFLGVTALLLVITVMQRLRIRGVRMEWRGHLPLGFPLWPTVFMGFVALFMVFANNAYPEIGFSVYLGYLTGGLLWFSAMVMARGVVVTEYGIVPGTGRPGDAVAWSQINDWFEVRDARRTTFVFIYNRYDNERRRLDLAVPRMHEDRFRHILAQKIGDCATLPLPTPAERKAMEGH